MIINVVVSLSVSCVVFIRIISTYVLVMSSERLLGHTGKLIQLNGKASHPDWDSNQGSLHFALIANTIPLYGIYSSINLLSSELKKVASPAQPVLRLSPNPF